MFLENFLLVFSSVFLSFGFVFYLTDDFTESRVLGARHSKRMLFVGIITLIIYFMIC